MLFRFNDNDPNKGTLDQAKAIDWSRRHHSTSYQRIHLKLQSEGRIEAVVTSLDRVNKRGIE